MLRDWNRETSGGCGSCSSGISCVSRVDGRLDANEVSAELLDAMAECGGGASLSYGGNSRDHLKCTSAGSRQILLLNSCPHGCVIPNSDFCRVVGSVLCLGGKEVMVHFPVSNMPGLDLSGSSIDCSLANTAAKDQFCWTKLCARNDSIRVDYVGKSICLRSILHPVRARILNVSFGRPS